MSNATNATDNALIATTVLTVLAAQKLAEEASDCDCQGVLQHLGNQAGGAVRIVARQGQRFGHSIDRFLGFRR